MRFDYLWGVVLVVIAILIGGWLISLRHPASPMVNPVHEAEQMLSEAGRLRDSASTLRAAGLPAMAAELDARANELAGEGVLVRQAPSLPARQLSEEFAAKARMLADSANRLRNAFLTLSDSLTRSQENRIARVERASRNLKGLARRLSAWGLDTREQRELYSSCILTYGDGARVCEQLRSEVPAGP